MKFPRLLNTAIVGAVVSTGLFISTPAVAAPDCTGADDVTVVVDYKDLGKDAQVLCAEASADKTAFDVLKTAGVTLQGTADFGDAAICRVNGLPDEKAESCETFSTTAYWALSLGTDGAWVFAEKGIQEQTVQGGTFLGLSYEPLGADPNAVAEPGLAPTADTRAQIAEVNEQNDEDSPNYLWPIVAVVVVAGVIVAVIGVRRRGGSDA